VNLSRRTNGRRAALTLSSIGIANSPETILISEHWTARDGKALSLLVIFFEPQALLDGVNVPHGLARNNSPSQT
jgi:hypothetical protein